MKIKCLSLAVVMLMLSCQKNIKDEIPSSDGMTANLELRPPPACNEMPMEMVKFSPPVIKDDAVEEALPPKEKTNTTTKKIIKDGNMSIKVEHLDSAKRYMDKIIKHFGAYYEQEEFTNYEKITRYGLKIRVPSNQFEKFLAAAEKGDGEIRDKSINVRDVTDEYTDTEIRLNTKQLFRKRYYELLTKAGKVDDMLAIEENIRVLQEDIESFEGRLKLMNDQISYSTLDLNLFTEKETVVVKDKTFGEKVKTNLKNGWGSVVSFVLWLIQQWPWFLVAAVLLFMIRRFWKKRQI
jgi:hypothetical protein